MLFLVMESLAVRCTGRYLPSLGNDIPLVSLYKGQHEICTCVLMPQRRGLASTCEAGPLPFLALCLLPIPNR
jgi:hypothetical protein